MGLFEVRAAIVSKLQSIEGTGIVHERERFFKDWAKFLQLFQDGDGRINGWIVTRKSTQSKRLEAPFIRRTYEMKMRGIYGMSDAEGSEIVFQDVVERIQDAFDADIDEPLGGTVMPGSGPLQIEVVELRTFGGVFCHVAELSYPAIVHVALT